MIRDEDEGYPPMSDEELVRAGLDASQEWCHFCNRWHEICPIGCKYTHTDVHTFCREVAIRQRTKEKIWAETSEEEQKLRDNPRWEKKILNNWGFWLYQKPWSLRGDRAAASNQNLSASARRWLAGEE